MWRAAHCNSLNRQRAIPEGTRHYSENVVDRLRHSGQTKAGALNALHVDWSKSTSPGGFDSRTGLDLIFAQQTNRSRWGSRLRLAHSPDALQAVPARTGAECALLQDTGCASFVSPEPLVVRSATLPSSSCRRPRTRSGSSRAISSRRTRSSSCTTSEMLSVTANSAPPVSWRSRSSRSVSPRPRHPLIPPQGQGHGPRRRGFSLWWKSVFDRGSRDSRSTGYGQGTLTDETFPPPESIDRHPVIAVDLV